VSASTLVDLQNTCQRGVSIQGSPVLSGAGVFPCSGAVIGQGIDLLHADTYCNLYVAGVSASGQLRAQVQCSDTDTSGSYTDPTSGLPQMPGAFSSGGILILNSGGTTGGLLNGLVSGEALASGFFVAQGFIRTGRFARVNFLSGDFAAGAITAGFISQFKTTGSGGGFTLLPGSGTVSV
jgi:hypothetical protein